MSFGWSGVLTNQNKKNQYFTCGASSFDWYEAKKKQHITFGALSFGWSEALTDQKQKQSAYHLAVEQVLAGQKYWDWMLSTIFKAIKRVGFG